MSLNNLRILFTLLVFASINSLFAQLTITQSTATNLVENVLVGAGVQVSNVTSGGNANQIGTFTNGNTVNLGVANGVMMTTGSFTTQSDQASGPGYIGSAANAGTSSTSDANTLADDPDLNSIISSFGAPATTNNIALIEFDFVPAGDSVAFNYVFASEEYNGFVCSQFFDVFGFFISGPGINGPYANNSENIAVVPNTNPSLPVSMNTINSGISDGGIYCPPGGLNNQAYFVDNSGSGNFSPYGYTTVLTAQANVQCGETYHIKLILANGSDQSYDSWVFLEAESFSSSIPDITIANLLPDSAFIEGCTTGEIVFRRNLAEDSLIIPLVFSGSAQNGTDYTGLPDSLIFLPGQDSIYYELQPADDGISEGVDGYEEIVISFVVVNECGQDFPVEKKLKIRDPYQINPGLNDTLLLCPKDNFLIASNPTGGYEPYSFIWNDSAGTTNSSFTLDVNSTQTFIVQVKDSLNCPNQPFADTITVTMEYQDLTPEFSIQTLCEGDTAVLVAQVENGLEPFIYSWSTGVFNDSIIVVASDSTFYTFTVEDACGFEVTDTAFVNVPIYDSLIVTTFDTTVCSNNPIAGLLGFATGGNGIYTYDFDGPGDITFLSDTTATVTVSGSSQYIVTVTDGCGTIAVDTLTVNVEACELIAYNAFSPNGDGKNDYFTIPSIQYYPGSTVYIFNRWGKKIFEKTDYQNDWSGNDVLTSGTYYYVIDPGDGSQQLKGYVTVFKD